MRAEPPVPGAARLYLAANGIPLMRPDSQVFTAKPRGMALTAAGRNLALSTIDGQERAARALAHRADVLSRNWSAVLSDE